MSRLNAEFCWPTLVKLLKMSHGSDMIKHLIVNPSLQLAHWHVDEEATIEGNGRTIYIRTSSTCQEQRSPCDIFRRAKTIRRDLTNNDIPYGFEELCRHCKSSQ